MLFEHLRSSFAALIVCIALPTMANSETLAADMQALMERLQTQCTRVFTTGPEVLAEFTEEMEDSWATESEDGASNYFVWLTDDYSRGMTVIVTEGPHRSKIQCEVSYGKYSDFDPLGAENGLRAANLQGRDVSVTGGAMLLSAGSRDSLEKLYTSEPLRFLAINGVFDDETIVVTGQIGSEGSVALAADGFWPSAESR